MSTDSAPTRPKVSRAATRKRKRLYIALAGLTMLGVAAALVLTAFDDSLVFFYTPSDIAEKGVTPGQRVRLGGLVAEGTVSKINDGLTTSFEITDLNSTVLVSYTGILPDLFREGQGVVAEGTIEPNGTMVATEVLAKHDENYMPAEVEETLRANGYWKDGEKDRATQ